ncbi:MAG TPA: SIR2 family protein [Thermoanaerobaculia bacterium]
MSPIPSGLIDAIRNGELVPFVGAGLSLSVGRDVFPSWKTLIQDNFVRRLESEGLSDNADSVRELCSSGELQKAAEEAFIALKKNRFIDEMEKAFGRARPPGADLSSVEALWRLQPRLVITTNYDSVLEWPLMGPWGTGVTLVHNENRSLLTRLVSSRNHAFIWHLHGSVKEPDSLILTQAQYLQFYKKSSRQYKSYKFALRQLQNLLAVRPLLFVGFSLQDAFVLQQMSEVLEMTSQASPVSYVLLHKNEVQDQSFLSRYNVQRIDFEDFGSLMAERLIEIGRAAWRGQYFTRIGPEPSPDMAVLVPELEAILRNVVLEPARLAYIFNATKPPHWDALPLSGDGWRFLAYSIAHLGAAIRQGGDVPFPLLEFVRGIEPLCPMVIRKQLRVWRKKAAFDLGLVSDEKEWKRLNKGFSKRPPPVARDPYVLVRLAEEASGRFRAQAWLFDSATPYKVFPDERYYARPDFGILVNDILVPLEALDIEPERSMLAFLLPRCLLVEAVDQWQPSELVAELPIGASHRVSVRSLDRLLNKRSMSRLRQKWKSLQKVRNVSLSIGDLTALKGSPSPRAVWLSPDDGSLPGIVSDLKGKVVCAVLAGSPPAAPVEPMRDLFNAVLQAGVPVILWARDPIGRDLIQTRANFEKLLAHVPVQRLAEQVRNHRREAADDGDPSHPGRCLTVLWDDPEHLPPDQDPNYPAVVQRS